MSYSFVVRGASKAIALAAAAAKMDEVVAGQPVHAADRDQVNVQAAAVVALIADPSATQDVSVSCSGSLSWLGTYPDSHQITGASVQVYATLLAKEEAKA